MADEPVVDVLIEEERLVARVMELGREIAEPYRNGPPPLLVCVLKGSVVFLADLVRAMDIDLHVDFMSISSYADSPTSSGVVRIIKDLETDLTGRDVVIVEDIVDTGLTLHYLRRTLAARSPASLRAVTLLDKAVRRIIPVELEWKGFEIPDVFVLGYGLDHEGLYRNACDLFEVPDIAHLVAMPRMYVPALWPDAVVPHTDVRPP
ncbi:MAG: hypoxanthine phosphoribosyltransferase [Actinomycetota bacterium]